MATMSAPPSGPAPARRVIPTKTSLRDAVFPTSAVFSSMIEHTDNPYTINWTIGNKQRIVPTTPIVFDSWTARAGKAASLTLMIDLRGGVQTVTFPATFTWLGAVPLMTEARMYVVSVIWDGVNFYGTLS